MSGNRSTRAAVRRRPLLEEHLRGRAAWAVVACLAIAVGSLGVALSNGEVAGFYHDDGIYALTGKALAQGDGYRLINLPSSPPATKYPPLYPALLSLVWRASSEFPANLPALKAVNAVLLALLVPVVYVWTGRLDRLSLSERLLACALTGTAPGLFWLSDILLSEALFVALACALFVVVEGRDSWTVTRSVLAGAVTGLAVLTRAPGLALALAAAIVVFRSGGQRQLWPFGAAFTALVVPWLIWRSLAAAEVGPLEAYYVSYEPSAWLRVFDDPAFVVRTVRFNAWFFLKSVPMVFGLPAAALTVMGLILGAAGAWLLRRTRTIALGSLWFGVTVIGLIGHPYPMERYLTPFVPLACVLMVCGAAWTKGLIFSAAGTVLSRVALLVPAAILLTVNVTWLRHYQAVSASSVHGEFGRALPFDWRAFAETALWIRQNTDINTRLASGHDTFYALNTGRDAVRPWVHRPEKYTAADGRNDPEPPDAAKVLTALGELNVCYLVVDPLLEGREGDWGRSHISAIVLEQTDKWRFVFTASSGRPQILFRKVDGCS